MYNDNTVRPLIDFEGKHFSMRQAFTTSIKERFTEKKKFSYYLLTPMRMEEIL